MPERDLDIFSFSAPSTDERTPLQPRPNSPILLRRDSEFSVGSEYDDGSPNNLNAWQGSALLTAECMGTGMLALPADVSVLGYGLGLGFLILNLPINLYAGTVFSHTAAAIETRQSVENRLYQGYIAGQPDDNLDYRVVNASTVDSELTADAEVVDYRAVNNDTAKSFVSILTTGTTHTRLHHDTATMDFIGMADALFRRRRSTRLVMIIYYVNLFLVLGNYILVMSHAVSAVFGERICLPAAGLVASTGMFVVSQSRTMARLGRTAAILSLVAIFIVVIQCIWAVQYGPIQAHKTVVAESSLLRKMSSIGGIGFAVGGQKLLLNVRHELSNRSAAPKSLAGALAFYGTFYVIICLLAGPNPPSFLFDAIQPGWNRQLAGLLLWGHVVVSYAINSQAICSSVDRLVWHRLRLPRSWSPAWRWMSVTAVVAVASYTVANAVPFFKDLVSLIGAVTSVPLTLLLPAIYWRKHLGVPLWKPTRDAVYSYALVVFAMAFMVVATIGSVYSIQQDWSSHGAPFACH